jgi:fluoroacetyl-CoA thioesterase
VPVQPGLAASIELKVSDDDTALALGSGSVPVLATPRLIALCEETTVKAIDGHLPAEQTSVGMRVQIDHLAPTAVGELVTADATLERVEGKRLVFTVSVTDHRGLIAAGKVTRVVVETARFMDKCT